MTFISGNVLCSAVCFVTSAFLWLVIAYISFKYLFILNMIISSFSLGCLIHLFYYDNINFVSFAPYFLFDPNVLCCPFLFFSHHGINYVWLYFSSLLHFYLLLFCRFNNFKGFTIYILNVPQSAFKWYYPTSHTVASPWLLQ